MDDLRREVIGLVCCYLRRRDARARKKEGRRQGRQDQDQQSQSRAQQRPPSRVMAGLHCVLPPVGGAVERAGAKAIRAPERNKTWQRWIERAKRTAPPINIKRIVRVPSELVK